MKWIIPTIAALSVLAAINVAEAARLKGGYYACISKAYLSEINTAKGSHKEWLLNEGCIVTRGGVEVHDLGFDGFAVKKVRVVLEGIGPVILWTPFENVER